MAAKEGSSTSAVPVYDEVHFQTYISLLKAACLNAKTEDLLGDEDPDDPINIFLEDNAALKTALEVNAISFSKEKLREDPLKHGKETMAEIKTRHATTTAQKKEYKKLLSEWKDWKAGEMHIYSIISRSISKHGWLLTGIPFGAGLNLLNYIIEYNSRTKTRENTATLLQALDSFVHDGKESLAKYKARLLELKTDLGNATTPEIISDERALYVYSYGTFIGL